MAQRSARKERDAGAEPVWQTVAALGFVLQQPPNALCVTNTNPREKAGVCCYSDCSAGKILSRALWGQVKDFALSCCLPRGICSFPGLYTDGCWGGANSQLPGGCRA